MCGADNKIKKIEINKILQINRDADYSNYFTKQVFINGTCSNFWNWNNAEKVHVGTIVRSSKTNWNNRQDNRQLVHFSFW